MMMAHPCFHINDQSDGFVHVENGIIWENHDDGTPLFSYQRPVRWICTRRKWHNMGKP